MFSRSARVPKGTGHLSWLLLDQLMTQMNQLTKGCLAVADGLPHT